MAETGSQEAMKKGGKDQILYRSNMAVLMKAKDLRRLLFDMCIDQKCSGE